MRPPPKKRTCLARNASVLMLVALTLCAPALAQKAKPGDVAKGKIVSDDGKTLVLNLEPCKGSGTSLTFSEPYTKKSIKSVKCPGSGKAYELVEVEQKGKGKVPDPKPEDPGKPGASPSDKHPDNKD